jgi:alkyl sulfatase BDS1-like metallo-beta-lactamase superfamily hydrolase
MPFDYWGVRLNGAKAASKRMSLVFAFTDLKKKYSVRQSRGRSPRERSTLEGRKPDPLV